MKKICNILIIILIIAIIAVLILIAIKYGKNQVNENETKKIIEEINNITDISNQEEITFKGYKVIGIIKIPKINLEYPILEKTTNESLKYSITKFWGNDLNQIGNVALAGHDNYDGTMFGNLHKLKNDDEIEIMDLNKNSEIYKVYETYITNPDDMKVLEEKKPGQKELTLITCNNTHKERYIVKACK